MNEINRNRIFEKKKHFVDITINKHFILLRSCYMDFEDVEQELYVRLLDLISRYDSKKCSNFDAYLMINLKYKLWNLATGSKRYGMPGAPCKGFHIASLETMANYYEPEDNSSSGSYDSLWLEKAIDDLPEKERKTLNNFLEGKDRIHCNNASLQSARRILKEEKIKFNKMIA